MFYSYKNFPISIESFNISGQKNPTYSNYEFVAQNITLNLNPNANFTFPVEGRKAYRAFNTEGITSTIQINFVGQVPYDHIFYNNILLQNGIKHNFKITCGDSVFESGYLRSFNTSVDPNNLVQHQAEFVFFNTGIGGFTGSSGIVGYPVESNSSNYYMHGANTLIAFSDNYNELGRHQVRRMDINYTANIQPVYNVGYNYPSRVAFNREEIDINIDLDSYNTSIRDMNNVISGTKILYTGQTGSSTGIGIFLRSGYLMNKSFNTRPNDIINSRILIKYFI
jgi:hypothetical protein